MKVTFRRSFARDLRKVKDQSVLDQIANPKSAIDRIYGHESANVLWVSRA